MAQLKEGSIIKKVGGDEVIATIDDIDKKVPTKISELDVDVKSYHKATTPDTNTNKMWLDTSI